jgi:hypothetical protein
MAADCVLDCGIYLLVCNLSLDENHAEDVAELSGLHVRGAGQEGQLEDKNLGDFVERFLEF